MKKKLIIEIFGVIAVLGVYQGLRLYMAESDIVASMLAAGPHTSVTKFMAASCFILMRILVIGILPAYVLYKSWILISDRLFPSTNVKKEIEPSKE